jgi:two-component sensor histidine kinase
MQKIRVAPCCRPGRQHGNFAPKPFAGRHEGGGCARTGRPKTTNLPIGRLPLADWRGFAALIGEKEGLLQDKDGLLSGQDRLLKEIHHRVKTTCKWS